jgi:hypothetical protein
LDSGVGLFVSSIAVFLLLENDSRWRVVKLARAAKIAGGATNLSMSCRQNWETWR